MSGFSRRGSWQRRLVAWGIGWLLAGALYLLLIDVIDLPELLVGTVAAALAATGLELAREQQLVGEGVRARWLVGLYRPLARVPADIALVAVVALRQLVRRDARCGAFRAVPFEGGDAPRDRGRRALAEAFGSFAPNTIIVGADAERGLILAHQLRPAGDRGAIDLLELG